MFAVKMVFCSLTRNTLNFAEQHGNTNSALFREILCIPRQKVQFLSVCSIVEHFAMPNRLRELALEEIDPFENV